MALLLTVQDTVWTDELYLRAPGSTEAGAKQALHNALREFTRDSGAWRVEMWDRDTGNGNVPIPFNEGTSPFYDIQAALDTAAPSPGTPYGPPASTDPFDQYTTVEAYWPFEVLYIHYLSYFDDYTWNADSSLRPHTATRFIYPGQTPHRRSPAGSFASTEGYPTIFHTSNDRPGQFELQTSLTAGGGVVPWVSLGFKTPLIEDAIPVIFQRYWYEAILDGALKNLFSQQDKPYTAPPLATYHGKRFRAAIARARDEAERQMNNAERGWMYPKWA